MHGENHITRQHLDMPDKVARDQANWDAMSKNLPYVQFFASGLINAGRLKYHLPINREGAQG